MRSALLLSLALGACRDARSSELAAPPSPPSSSATTAATAPGPAPPACEPIWSALAAKPVGIDDVARAATLGRVRGAAPLFIGVPTLSSDAGLSAFAKASRTRFDREPSGFRVDRLVARHASDPKTLRSLVLRDGYVFGSDPLDAAALDRALSLPKLFDEPVIHLQRGSATRRLERRAKPARYVYADEPGAGDEAALLHGDRVAVTADELAKPLHRDVLELTDRIGADRARVRGGDERSLALELRASGAWRRAVLDAEGARLSVRCWVESDAEALAGRARAEPRHRALEKVRAAIGEIVRESLRFDRPFGEKTAERDGELRPVWLAAYKRGGRNFAVDEAGYPVFDAQGRPHPPEVCVDFVLDALERGSGTWFAPLGSAPARTVGGLDFEPVGGRSLRGVIALFDWAKKHPDLFVVERIPDAKRVPFGDRARFFASLPGFELRAGDIVAIQGEKADGLVHQHAIFVERIDPLTGVPFGLADQMSRPKRRSWEGIMAEAPKRSLLYRIRPTDELWRRIAER